MNGRGRSRLGLGLMWIGLLGLTIGVVVMAYNVHEAYLAEQSAVAAVQALDLMIDTEDDPNLAEQVSGAGEIPLSLLLGDDEEDQDTEMTEVEIDGHWYIGKISIPTLGLELPIMSQWSYPNLKISPCRYSGTARGGDLILLAHNYARHFGSIKTLVAGDPVIFTDMDGNVFTYQVLEVEILQPMAVEEMESGSDGNWDLTLFTCTIGGKTRVTVRCALVGESEE